MSVANWPPCAPNLDFGLVADVNIGYKVTVSNIVTVSGEEPRVRRKRANTDRILTAALDIVVAEGFAALTLQRVAQSTDYTRAALYRYFDSKEALIGALTVRVIAEIASRTSTRLEKLADASPLASPLTKVRAVIDEYQRFAAESPEKFGMLSMLLAESRVLLPGDDAAEPAIAALESALRPLAHLLDAATSRGELDAGDNESRAVVLFASIHGALQLRKQSARSNKLASTRALCTIALDGLLGGWGAAR